LTVTSLIVSQWESYQDIMSDMSDTSDSLDRSGRCTKLRIVCHTGMIWVRLLLHANSSMWFEFIRWSAVIYVRYVR